MMSRLVAILFVTLLATAGSGVAVAQSSPGSQTTTQAGTQEDANTTVSSEPVEEEEEEDPDCD